MRPIASWWCALGCCLWGSWARAQPEGTRFSLEYSVPSGCPERAEFVASLASRSRGAREQAESPQVRLSVLLSGSRELASGALIIQLADGQESRREVPEARCVEVLSSMTVIAAMILDGGGLDDPPPETNPSEAGAVREPRAGERGGSGAAPPRRIAAQIENVGQAPPLAPVRRGIRLAAIAGVGPQSGVASSLVLRISVGLGLVFDRVREPPPTLDLVASLAESGREVGQYGDAKFRLLALSLTGCPFGWAWAARFVLRPCVPLELGVLRGDGDNTVRARIQDMPWAGLGLGLRAEAALSRAVLLELDGRALVLARADRFVFEPDSVAHDVPRVAFGLRLGAAVRVP